MLIAKNRDGTEPHNVPKRIDVTEGAATPNLGHLRCEKVCVAPVTELSLGQACQERHVVGREGEKLGTLIVVRHTQVCLRFGLLQPRF